MIRKAAVLAFSIFFTFLFLSSGCVTDPYEIGDPDSLYSEFILVWDLIDSHYSCFFAREDVDWDEVWSIYKPLAMELTSRDEFNEVCLAMLGELEDMSLSLQDAAGNRYDSCNKGYFDNWDSGVWQSYMIDWGGTDSLDYRYGAFPLLPPHDSIGYLYIGSLGSDYNLMGFFSATDTVRECSRLILDLRMCHRSGLQVNAYYSMGRFTQESDIGFFKSIRTGPGRTDMGEMVPVFANKNGSWQFTDPIIVLTGRGTQTAAEQLTLLLRTQEHVTVIGDTTAGYANPSATFNLTGSWTIDIPQMVTYSPDTSLIFDSGIVPDIVIPVTEADFAAGIDPVLDAALEMVSR